MSKPDPVPSHELNFADTIMVRDACLCLHTQRAARALARRFDRAFKPFGLTNGQFSLLMGLNRPSPPNMKAVATLLAMDRTTLTAALKPLEGRGLVEVAADPTDARNRLMSLTKAGRALLARAMPVWIAHHSAIEQQLGAGEAGRMREDMGRLTVAAGEGL